MSFLLVILGMAWAYASFRSTVSPIILQFNNYDGITKIGSLIELELFGVFGLVMLSINLLVANTLEKRALFLANLAAVWSFFLGTLLFLGFAAIISVN